MKYDPIKKSLGIVFNATPVLRIVFYRLLDLLLLRAWHIRKELKIWAAKNQQPLQILDAGSGFGQYSYYMSKLNPAYKITGTDIKEEQIFDCSLFFSKINKAEQVSFEYADLTQFVQNETYNLILSVDVMEHIEADTVVFDNFYKSMKPGGMLLISTPSDKGGSDVHDDHEHSFIDEHVRDGYNMDDITLKLKNAGFSKVEARYSYGTSGSLAWKLSMKYPIIMLNASKLFFILLPFYYVLTYPFAFILNYIDVNSNHNEGTGLIVKAVK
ncbi:MAG TPA: methyltransferase type 11 [Bacteroidales bacterium]|nr:methyltransferase type 11 [Bacteroidales bacterium]